MITENGRTRYVETVIEVAVTIPGDINGFYTDEQYLNSAFEAEVKKFDLGMEPGITVKCSCNETGFREYHGETNTWTCHYTIKVTQPVLRGT